MRAIEGDGTDEHDWRAWPAPAGWPALDPAGCPRAVVVAPHPDDEVLGVGGLLATLVGLGREVTVVAVTDGEAAYPDHPGPDLAAVRRAESVAALGELGVAPEAVVRCGVPDGRVGEHEAALTARLRELARPGDWLLAPWVGDGHPDHEAAGRAAAAAGRAGGCPTLGYLVWTWHWAVPDDPRVPWRRARRVALDDRARAAKRAAVQRHTSQIRPPGPGAAPVLPPATLARFDRDHEVLLAPEGDDPTLPAAYFDRLYAEDRDPWGFERRWYEQRRYALVLASLPARRYRSAFEPGCSVGVLTALLAERCDRLLASDASPAAVTETRRRVADHPEVTVQRRELPADWPDATFDLVVLAELLYYLSRDDLATVARRAVRAVAPGGTLLAVHWRHPAPDYPASGDAVHAALREAAAGALVPLARHEEDDLLLEVWTAPAPGEHPGRVSVAARDGVV